MRPAVIRQPHEITRIKRWSDGKLTVIIDGKHTHAGSKSYLRKLLKDRYGLDLTGV